MQQQQNVQEVKPILTTSTSRKINPVRGNHMDLVQMQSGTKSQNLVNCIDK